MRQQQYREHTDSSSEGDAPGPDEGHRQQVGVEERDHLARRHLRQRKPYREADQTGQAIFDRRQQAESKACSDDSDVRHYGDKGNTQLIGVGTGNFSLQRRVNREVNALGVRTCRPTIGWFKWCP